MTPLYRKKALKKIEEENSILNVVNNGRRKLSVILYKGALYAPCALLGFEVFFSIFFFGEGERNYFAAATHVMI